MSKLSISANNKTYEAGQQAVEKLEFSHKIEDEVDDRGVMTARPSHLEVNVQSVMSRQTGKLPLLAIAIASQLFNLLAKDKDKHPQGVFTEQTKRGRRTVDLWQLHISDFQAGEFRWSWVGGGNDGLQGCTVIESLKLFASAGKIVNLVDNSEAPFDLRQ